MKKLGTSMVVRNKLNPCPRCINGTLLYGVCMNCGFEPVVQVEPAKLLPERVRDAIKNAKVLHKLR